MLNSSGRIQIGISAGGGPGEPAAGSNQSINLEFGQGGTARTRMSQLYKGGPIVSANATAPNVPTSGLIRLTNFNGASAAAAIQSNFTLTVASSRNNYNLRASLISAGWNGTIVPTVTVNINAGVIISSTSYQYSAFETGILPAGSIIRINNRGIIAGKGGTGGENHGGFGAAGVAGTYGGTAIFAQSNISLDNTNGTIQGGGGGGGSAGSPSNQASYFVESGGGGGGASYGRGGYSGESPASYGKDGTLTTGGLGGIGYASKRGGNGGNPGQAGLPGQQGENFGGAGGAGGSPGWSIYGISKVTMLVSGTITGPTAG